jgi:hypothetical protein
LPIHEALEFLQRDDQGAVLEGVVALVDADDVIDFALDDLNEVANLLAQVTGKDGPQQNDAAVALDDFAALDDLEVFEDGRLRFPALDDDAV